MEWPSNRVKPGGVFQPAKANYSPETKQFLQVLLDESKLTMFQRKKVDYSLRSGEPLPVFKNKSSSRFGSKLPTFTIRPGSSKRRSHDTIIKSGAYEKPTFVPRYPKVDRDKAKKHLQDMMAYGKVLAETPRRPKGNKTIDIFDWPEENRFDQLMREIEDRRKWLEEMEELGEGKKYKNVIELQIQEKLREMEKLQFKGDNSLHTCRK